MEICICHRLHVSILNWYCWFILHESCDTGAHTGLCAGGLEACEPQLCNTIWFHAHRTFVSFFSPTLFFFFFNLPDSSPFSSCPEQFPLWGPFCLIIQTRMRNQTSQYPLCGNHGAARAVLIKSTMTDQTELPNKVRSSFSSRQLRCYDKNGPVLPSPG